jgi:hypothetical protein
VLKLVLGTVHTPRNSVLLVDLSTTLLSPSESSSGTALV